MAINKIRQSGNRTIPSLKDKIFFSDIVNDVTTGGTGKPLSAEAGKNLQGGISQEVADRSQAIVDLKGGVSASNATLKKLEDNLNQEISDRGTAISTEVTDRDAAILVEENRALAQEAVLANDIANLASGSSTATADEETRAKAEEARIETKLDGEISATDAEIALLNDIDTVAGSVAYAVKAEQTRAISEETRIDGKVDTEKTDRIAAITATEAYADAAVLVEKTRAEGAEATNATAIATEVTDRGTEITRVDGVITALTSTVSGNKTAIEAALSTEVTNRTNADSALSGRLSAVEGTLVAGVSWKGSVADLAGIDALVEGDLVAGQAYYVTSEKDVYVVLPDQGGDYVPSGFTSKSFLKIADFAELTGLVTAEKNRSVSEETRIESKVDSEISTRGSEITRVEGLISTEATRAGNAEVANTNAITQLDTDYKAADTAMTAAYIAADGVVDTRVTNEVATLNSTITSNNTAQTTALNSEITRATAAEVANAAAITTLNADDQTVGSVAYDILVEETRAKAAELVNANAISQEATDRIADVDAEESRATTAEGVIDTKVDTEIQDRKDAITAEETTRKDADDALDLRLDVIEGDNTTVGSVLYAELEAKKYADLWIPMMKLEGLDGSVTVSGDSITTTYAPIADGVIFGEVIVYAGDNDSEAVAVNVASISGTTINLDVVTAGEFDGKVCKIQYMFNEASQSGASMGTAGSGGAGN
jgi:hypothetical protein